jgi:hypothetical protein
VTARRLLVLGGIVAAIGLVIAGPPYATLYDGVPVVPPYVYLDPGPDQPGSPVGATATIKVINGASDLLALATPELVPQAQVFVIPGGLALPPGTTRIDVSIAAVEPTAQPTDGHIAGNVYAFNLTNDAGLPVSATTEAQASIELRAPDQATTTATIERFDGTSWQPVSTTAAGIGALFTAVVTQFGEFAVVLPGAAATGAASPPGSAAAPSIGGPSVAPSETPAGPSSDNRETLTLLLGGAAVVIVLVVAALAFLPSRGRRSPPPRSTRSGGSSRRR